MNSAAHAYGVPGPLRDESTSKRTGSLATEGIPDEALVVRGGLNTADRITNGSGVWTDEAGNIHDVSVNSAPGRTVDELGASPTGRSGLQRSDRSALPAATSFATLSRTALTTASVSGLSAEALSGLLAPTIRNPSC
jgi:hypothetical protein